MADIAGSLSEVVGEANVLTGESIADDYSHDEALTASAQRPTWLVRPGSTDEVARLVALA